MKKIVGIAFLGFLSSCGLLKMLPQKEALSLKSRQNIENTHQKTTITYKVFSGVDFPIIPFQIFGVTYDQDIVIVTQHPKWNMHEYAKIDFGANKSSWLMKDSKEASLTQYLTTNDKNLLDLLPEIPLQTSVQDFKINEIRNDDTLEIEFEYQNILQEKVKAYFKGTNTLPPLKMRNGSTMGHSRNQVMAILDLPYREFGTEASISYNDSIYKIKKLLGIQGFQMLLSQTQGGLSTGAFKMNYKNGIETVHLNDNQTVQNWTVTKTKSTLILKQTNSYRTQQYFFEIKENNYLLQSAEVKLWNSEIPSFKISFYPPLPDFRYQFEGEHQSKFVFDVNGQKNHGYGTVFCNSKENKLSTLRFLPIAPWWIKERPLKSTVQINADKSVMIHSEMINMIEE